MRFPWRKIAPELNQLKFAISALRGAEVNCIDSLGYTPLLLALAASDSEYLIRTVELLCQFGADVNCSSDLMVRDTPLHFAAALGNDEIIELLFRHIRYVSKGSP